MPWVDGGLTNLDNLTLLCRWHHHQFEQRGWMVALDLDRIPAWTPPRWIDPERRPLVSTRIQQRRLSARGQPALLDAHAAAQTAAQTAAPGPTTPAPDIGGR